jgi:hypothetical protein
MKSQLELTGNASCEFICFNDSRYIWPNYLNAQETLVFLTGRILLQIYEREHVTGLNTDLGVSIETWQHDMTFNYCGVFFI